MLNTPVVSSHHVTIPHSLISLLLCFKLPVVNSLLGSPDCRFKKLVLISNLNDRCRKMFVDLVIQKDIIDQHKSSQTK